MRRATVLSVPKQGKEGIHMDKKPKKPKGGERVHMGKPTPCQVWSPSGVAKTSTLVWGVWGTAQHEKSDSE